MSPRLRNWAHWVAWFIQSLFFVMLSISAIAIEIAAGKVLTYSNVLIVWLFLAAFGVVCAGLSFPDTPISPPLQASVNFCFLVSVFFSRANTVGGGAET